MSLINDISGREYIYWPLPVKAIIWLALFSFILVGGYFLVWSGTIDSYNLSVEKENQLKVTLKDKLKASQGKKELQDQIGKINASFGELLKLLPTNASIENLIYDINQVGASKGIALKSIEGQGVVQAEYFARIPARLAFTTTYNELGRFVEDLSRLPRIVTLEQFSIDRVDNNDPSVKQLNISVIANTYRSVEQKK